MCRLFTWEELWSWIHGSSGTEIISWIRRVGSLLHVTHRIIGRPIHRDILSILGMDEINYGSWEKTTEMLPLAVHCFQEATEA